MIDSLVYTSYDTGGTVFNFYTDPIVVAIIEFDWNYPIEGEGIPKFQQPGQWEVASYVEALPINLDGDIMGDDSADYWVNRKAFMDAIIPKPVMTSKFHGRFTMAVDGDATVLYADVQLKTNGMPLRALYPSVTSFTLGFECPFGYWRKVSDDTVVIV